MFSAGTFLGNEGYQIARNSTELFRFPRLGPYRDPIV